MSKNPKLIDKWFRTLPADAQQAVRALVRLAEARGAPLYLVGGPLRDLLLGHPSLDIDLMLEGDAPALASELATTLGSRPKLHPAFGTATIRGDGWHIDLATARRETYRRPGALPDVTPASVGDDLRRRDFTINAMALRLDGPEAGVLLDPFGGQRDVAGRAIRVLHESSFQDDATRILRAARYVARLRFRIDADTSRWLERHARYLSEISPARIHHEFARIAAEHEPERALVQLDARGVLPRIHPALRFGKDQERAMKEARSRGAPVSSFWPILAFNVLPGPANTQASRLGLTRHQRAAVEGVPRLIQGIPTLFDVTNGALVDVLDAFPHPTVWAVAMLVTPVADRLVEYLTTLRHVKPLLRGHDVIALGVPHGTQVGEVLRRLRVAKLDGEVRTRRDEERFVRSLLAGAPVG